MGQIVLPSRGCGKDYCILLDHNPLHEIDKLCVRATIAKPVHKGVCEGGNV